VTAVTFLFFDAGKTGWNLTRSRVKEEQKYTERLLTTKAGRHKERRKNIR
jgi:hypothetical protein